MQPDLIEHVIRPSLPEQFADDDFEVFVNPTGAFELGGPHADCGLTGRKIIVDTYGGMARHGGGAFSGKDPTKVDRSAAYAVRQIAKNVVAAGLAKRCEVQVAYAIGVAHPVSIMVETFGTSRDRPATSSTALVRDVFDMRPAAIIERLDLRRPIFQRTAAYGHFGRSRPRLHVGAHRRRRRAAPQRRRRASAIVASESVRVQPDVPAIHRAFDYSAFPTRSPARVRVGTIVRVPLHGRRVRGWVLDADVAEPEVDADGCATCSRSSSAGPPRRRRRPVPVGGVALGRPARAFLRAASAAERRRRRPRARASRPRSYPRRRRSHGRGSCALVGRRATRSTVAARAPRARRS